MLTVCGRAALAQTQPDFVVHGDRVVTPSFLGFGVQMNPYLYCNPNSAEIPPFNLRLLLNPYLYGANFGDVTRENAEDLERKIIALAPQHVRIFCLLEWY